jgi:hypothetical protein
MGSPLSFPILCIINAALCKFAFDDGKDFSDTRVKLRDMPIKVNGDDCVMNFNEKQKASWYHITAHAGLEPSVGKCYWAKDWLQMNSELFYLKDGTFKKADFMNFSLCSPKSSKGDDHRTWMDLEAIYLDFRKGCKYPSEASKIFRSNIYNVISRAPKGICWSLPSYLGGLGICDPDPAHPPTYRQLQLASYLIEKQIKDGHIPQTAPRLKKVPDWVSESLLDCNKYARSKPIQKSKLYSLLRMDSHTLPSLCADINPDARTLETYNPTACEGEEFPDRYEWGRPDVDYYQTASGLFKSALPTNDYGTTMGDDEPFKVTPPNYSPFLWKGNQSRALDLFMSMRYTGVRQFQLQDGIGLYTNGQEWTDVKMGETEEETKKRDQKERRETRKAPQYIRDEWAASKEFTRAWERSKKTTPLPLELILRWPRPERIIPSGLAQAKLGHLVPKGVLDKITAATQDQPVNMVNHNQPLHVRSKCYKAASKQLWQWRTEIEC